MLDYAKDVLYYLIYDVGPFLLSGLADLTWAAGIDIYRLPAWGWVPVCLFVLWALTSLGRNLKKGKSRYWSQKSSAARKASQMKHKSWQNEALSVLKTIQSKKADDQVLRQTLNGMSPFAFEYLITEGLKQQGIRTRKLKRVVADGGIDGMAELKGRWHLIQAKRYAGPVSQGLVGEFLQLCVNKHMPGLFVATSGFSAPAKRFADQHARLTLLDADDLLVMFR